MLETTSTAGVATFTPTKRRKKRKPLHEEDGGNVNGFELSEDDIKTLHAIRDGHNTADDEAIAWLRECGLIDENDKLTELGQNIA